MQVRKQGEWRKENSVQTILVIPHKLYCQGYGVLFVQQIRRYCSIHYDVICIDLNYRNRTLQHLLQQRMCRTVSCSKTDTRHDTRQTRLALEIKSPWKQAALWYIRKRLREEFQHKSVMGKHGLNVTKQCALHM